MEYLLFIFDNFIHVNNLSSTPHKNLDMLLPFFMSFPLFL